MSTEQKLEKARKALSDLIGCLTQVSNLQGQADAWAEVCHTMGNINPSWAGQEPTGKASMARAIKQLATEVATLKVKLFQTEGELEGESGKVKSLEEHAELRKKEMSALLADRAKLHQQLAT